MGLIETYPFVHNFGLYNKAKTGTDFRKDILTIHNRRLTDLSVTERYISPAPYFGVLDGWLNVVSNTDTFTEIINGVRITGYYYWTDRYSYIKTPSFSEWEELTKNKFKNKLFDYWVTNKSIYFMDYTEGIASTISKVEKVYSVFGKDDSRRNTVIAKHLEKQGIEFITDIGDIDLDNYGVFEDISYPKDIKTLPASSNTGIGSRRKYICGSIAMRICMLSDMDIVLKFFSEDWDKVVEICSESKDTDVLMNLVDKVLFPYYGRRTYRGILTGTTIRKDILWEIGRYLSVDKSLDKLDGELFPIDPPKDRIELKNNILYKPSPSDYIELLKLFSLNKETALWFYWSMMGYFNLEYKFRDLIERQLKANKINLDVSNVFHTISRL